MKYKIVDYTNIYNGLMQFNKNRTEYIHRWYSFVEGYSKEFIESILGELGYTPKHCLDPFAGSGTTPLELQKKNITCSSFEVNPFMHRLAQAKMETTYRSKTVKKYITEMHKMFYGVEWAKSIHRNNVPQYRQIVESCDLKKWIFNKDTFDDLMKIRYCISYIRSKKYRTLFEIAYASVLLSYSNVYRNGKCLSYKKNWQSIKSNKSVFDSFILKLEDEILPDVKKLELHSKAKNLLSNKNQCLYGDVRRHIFSLSDNSVDLIITSPPYLNSRDYTDIYMVELWMLDLVNSYDSLRQLRYRTLRSHVQIKHEQFMEPVNSMTLKNALAQLRLKEDAFWSKDLLNMIIGYFNDMDILFGALKTKTKKNAKIYFNVANSAYCGVLIEVDSIIADIATTHGFTIEEIRVAREINPSAQQKYLGKLRESVIVIEKC